MGFAPAPLPSLSLVFFAPDNAAGSPAPFPSLGLVLGAATAPTLVASVGDFALTGVAGSLKAGHKVAASAGSFALSGQNATLTNGTVSGGVDAPAYLPSIGLVLAHSDSAPFVIGSPGAFALSGVAVNLLRGHGVVCGTGTFLLNGAPALRDMQVTADKATFALTGKAATLKRTTPGVTASAGAFTFSGKAAGLSYETSAAKVLSAFAGDFTVTGQDVTFPTTIERKLVADRGTFALTLNSASLVFVGWVREDKASGTWTNVTSASGTWTNV